MKKIRFPEVPPQRMVMSSSPRYMAALEDICNNMRREEQLQHLAFMAAVEGEPLPDYNARAAFLAFAQQQGVAAYYLDDEMRPAATGGFVHSEQPGVWNTWMAGTDAGWANCWMDITRGTRFLIRQLMEGGARRIETSVLDSRAAAQRWFVDFLGMQFEGRRRSYCVDGGDVLMYSITRSDWIERQGQNGTE